MLRKLLTIVAIVIAVGVQAKPAAAAYGLTSRTIISGLVTKTDANGNVTTVPVSGDLQQQVVSPGESIAYVLTEDLGFSWQGGGTPVDTEMEMESLGTINLAYWSSYFMPGSSSGSGSVGSGNDSQAVSFSVTSSGMGNPTIDKNFADINPLWHSFTLSGAAPHAIVTHTLNLSVVRSNIYVAAFGAVQFQRGQPVAKPKKYHAGDALSFSLRNAIGLVGAPVIADVNWTGGAAEAYQAQLWAGKVGGGDPFSHRMFDAKFGVGIPRTCVLMFNPSVQGVYTVEVRLVVKLAGQMGNLSQTSIAHRVRINVK